MQSGVCSIEDGRIKNACLQPEYVGNEKQASHTIHKPGEFPQPLSPNTLCFGERINTPDMVFVWILARRTESS